MVAKNVKKAYTNKITQKRSNDIEYFDENSDLLEMSALFQNYRSNDGIEGQNKYTELYHSLNKHTVPFMSENPDVLDNVFNASNGVIIEANVNSDINVKKLGRWIRTQNSNYKKKTNIMLNSNIYDQWTNFIQDDKYKNLI